MSQPSAPLDNIKRLFVSFFTLSEQLVPQAEAEETIREGVSFRGTNIIILILAILIASLGLNTNSTAVIIGAMLISPLMGPIIGIGLGVGVQDFSLIKRSMRNLVMAAGFSVAASTCYFLISPVAEGHSELLARTSPTIYDVLIGFVGGGAGIVAIASRSKGNVIPGVAIATALMPPLCTVGYGLATLQASYFFGALYLFLINSIFIALATFIGVKLLHYVPVTQDNPQRAKKVRRTIYAIAILTMLPSVYLTYNMLRTNRFEMNANRFVSEEFNFPGTHVLNSSARIIHGERVIEVSLLGKPLPLDSLRLALDSRLGYYGLSGVRLNIVQGSQQAIAASSADMTESTVRDIYQMAQSSLSAKQVTIDSLRAVLSLRRAHDSISASLAPEVAVVFPQIKDISVSRNYFSDVRTGKLDTVNIALIVLSKPLTATKKTELSRYLEARLSLKEVQIVETTTLRLGKEEKDTEKAAGNKK